MEDRSKILTQILIINEQYDIQILSIEFKNINITMEEVNILFKIGPDKFKISYLYSKDDILGVNGFLRYFNNELKEVL